jgi:hypothetical protein
LVVVMMVRRMSAEDAVRAIANLAETVPWAGVTSLPTVSPVIAFGITESHDVHVIAQDEANDRHHTFIVDTTKGTAQQAAARVDHVIHAPFN